MSNETNAKTSPVMSFLVGFALAAVIAAGGMYLYVIPKLEKKVDDSHAVRNRNARHLEALADRVENMDGKWWIQVHKIRMGEILREISTDLDYLPSE